MERAGTTPRRLLAGLLAADAGFVVIYAWMIEAGITATRAFRIFDLDREGNPPTWFASSQLLLVALAFFVLACRPFADHPKVKRLRGGFLGLSLLFTYLSLDEGGVVHERLSDLLGRGWYVPALHGRGLVVLLIAIAACALVAFCTVRYALPAARIWPRQLFIFLGGCALVVAGGIVSEVVVHSLHLHVSPMGALVEIGLEEFGEMVGCTLTVFAAATMLAEVWRDILALSAPAAVAATADVAEAIAGPAPVDRVAEEGAGV